MSIEVVQHTAMMEHCAVLCYSTHCMCCAVLAGGAHIFPYMHIGLIGLKLQCMCVLGRHGCELRNMHTCINMYMYI